MEEIREKVKELETSWNSAFEVVKDSNQEWKKQLPYLTPIELNEVMGTIFYLFERVRAPRGFTPNFNLAKHFALITFDSVINNAKKIEQGQLANLSFYISGVIQISNALNSLLLFSSNDTPDIPQLNANIGQSISLIRTAQTELKEKMELITESMNKLKESESIIEKMTENDTSATQLVEEIKTLHADSDSTAKKIKNISTEIEELKNELAEGINQVKLLNDELYKDADRLTRLQSESEDQQELIDQLLPKGASTGLAHAFGLRSEKLEKTKWIWMGIFISSLVLLAIAGIFIVEHSTNTNQDFLIIFIRRLPIIAPLVWLGWFSAIQYGNTVRVQEDYAFKEATSKAFAGYKDHMEHIATINTDEAHNAMNLLSVKTIKILAREPLRIYNHSDSDASPWHSMIMSRKNDKKKDVDDIEIE